ncbi:hypothetical protein TNCV_4884041 [Trichonephila clavipes]|nr:hypothetical protein TNCV_4884041 [Trichonephila clavipes]
MAHKHDEDAGDYWHHANPQTWVNVEPVYLVLQASAHAENKGVNELLRHCCPFVLQRQSKLPIVTGGKVRAAKRLPRKSHTCSMGLRSGDHAGQSICSISSLSKSCSAATVR